MDHRPIDARIVELATAHHHHHVVTTRQLRAAGITLAQIERRVGRLLTRVSQGTYIVGRPSPPTLLSAALAALPSAAACHHSAAAIHRLPVQPGGEVSVEMAGRTRRAIHGVRIRHTRWLPPDDVTVEPSGVRVTTVARTICDLAAELPVAHTSHLIEQAVIARLMAPGELQACAAAWCRRGRPGSGVIRRLDHELLDHEPVPASVLEHRAFALFVRAGLSGWVPQYAPPWYDAVRGIVDVAWPEHRVIVELDGRRWHATARALGDDRRRDRAAVLAGWVTIRLGWHEIVHRPDTVLVELRAVLDARRPTDAIT
ncbi:MAG: endonuclease domain-containing protein [Acidimicrobiia bacterium]|nr:endonuclease domain-containing protein [Acidimicrobiia bacterium]